MFYEEYYRNLTNTNTKNNVFNDPISVTVFVIAKDNKSMLQVTHLNATISILDNLATNFYLYEKNFYNFCTDFCQFNEPIRQFSVEI